MLVSIAMSVHTVDEVVRRTLYTVRGDRDNGYINAPHHCHSTTARFIAENAKRNRDAIVVFAGDGRVVTHSFVLDDETGAVISDTFRTSIFKNGRHAGKDLKSGRPSVAKAVKAMAAYRLGSLVDLSRHMWMFDDLYDSLPKVKVA